MTTKLLYVNNEIALNTDMGFAESIIGKYSITGDYFFEGVSLTFLNMQQEEGAMPEEQNPLYLSLKLLIAYNYQQLYSTILSGRETYLSSLEKVLNNQIDQLKVLNKNDYANVNRIYRLVISNQDKPQREKIQHFLQEQLKRLTIDSQVLLNSQQTDTVRNLVTHSLDNNSTNVEQKTNTDQNRNYDITHSLQGYGTDVESSEASETSAHLDFELIQKIFEENRTSSYHSHHNNKKINKMKQQAVSSDMNKDEFRYTVTASKLYFDNHDIFIDLLHRDEPDRSLREKSFEVILNSLDISKKDKEFFTRLIHRQETTIKNNSSIISRIKEGFLKDTSRNILNQKVLQKEIQPAEIESFARYITNQDRIVLHREKFLEYIKKDLLSSEIVKLTRIEESEASKKAIDNKDSKDLEAYKKNQQAASLVMDKKETDSKKANVQEADKKDGNSKEADYSVIINDFFKSGSNPTDQEIMQLLENIKTNDYSLYHDILKHNILETEALAKSWREVDRKEAAIQKDDQKKAARQRDDGTGNEKSEHEKSENDKLKADQLDIDVELNLQNFIQQRTSKNSHFLKQNNAKYSFAALWTRKATEIMDQINTDPFVYLIPNSDGEHSNQISSIHLYQEHLMKQQLFREIKDRLTNTLLKSSQLEKSQMVKLMQSIFSRDELEKLLTKNIFTKVEHEKLFSTNSISKNEHEKSFTTDNITKVEHEKLLTKNRINLIDKLQSSQTMEELTRIISNMDQRQFERLLQSAQTEEVLNSITYQVLSDQKLQREVQLLTRFKNNNGQIVTLGRKHVLSTSLSQQRIVERSLEADIKKSLETLLLESQSKQLQQIQKELHIAFTEEEIENAYKGFSIKVGGSGRLSSEKLIYFIKTADPNRLTRVLEVMKANPAYSQKIDRILEKAVSRKKVGKEPFHEKATLFESSIVNNKLQFEQSRKFTEQITRQNLLDIITQGSEQMKVTQVMQTEMTNQELEQKGQQELILHNDRNQTENNWRTKLRQNLLNEQETVLTIQHQDILKKNLLLQKTLISDEIEQGLLQQQDTPGQGIGALTNPVNTFADNQYRHKQERNEVATREKVKKIVDEYIITEQSQINYSHNRRHETVHELKVQKNEIRKLKESLSIQNKAVEDLKKQIATEKNSQAKVDINQVTKDIMKTMQQQIMVARLRKGLD